MMTLKDVETAWIVSQWTIYRWLAEGKIQTLMLGTAFFAGRPQERLVSAWVPDMNLRAPNNHASPKFHNEAHP